METTLYPLSQATIDALGIKHDDMLVYDMRDYSLLYTCSTLLEAMEYMEKRFHANMEHRTALFKLQGNELEFIMISDDLFRKQY
jgi:hypothetical protein